MGERSWMALTLALLALGCTEGQRVELAGYRSIEVAALQARGWRTDFARHDVPLASIEDAGLARELFVPIRDVRRARADELALGDSEPLVVLRGEGVPRAWPIVHLLRRELALDEVDGVPIAVTFCSLCASARVFDRRVGEQTLELGVSGLVRDGNALLYDRASESLWSQLTGEALVGAYAGKRLATLPAIVVSFGELARAHPEALVMLPPAPAPDPPLALLGARDLERHDPPGWIELPGEDPLATVLVTPAGVVDVVGPRASQLPGVVVLRDPACAAPFRDAEGGAGPVQRAAAAFVPALGQRALSFEVDQIGVRDRETGSRWNALGEATAGPLAGARLEPLEQVQCFRHAARGPLGGR